MWASVGLLKPHTVNFISVFWITAIGDGSWLVHIPGYLLVFGTV